jgi:plastocyanin
MKPLAFLCALALAALTLVSCGGGDSTTTGEGATGTTTDASEAPAGSAPAGAEAERSAKVEIVDFAYDPDPVRVAAGGKVIWQNMDSAPHTATADDGSFDTGTIEEGKLKSETEAFKEPGVFPYHCEIHPTMHGVVEVVAPE